MMKTALPSRGLSGVEKSPERRACTNSMAESGHESRRWWQAHGASQPPSPGPAAQAAALPPKQQAADTGHGKRLGKGVEGRAPGDLPGRDVGQHKTQLVQQIPQLAEEPRADKKHWVTHESRTHHDASSRPPPGPRGRPLAAPYYCQPSLSGLSLRHLT